MLRIVLALAMLTCPPPAHAANPPGWFQGYSDETINLIGCTAGQAVDAGGQTYQPCVSIDCWPGQGVTIQLWSGLNRFPSRAPAAITIDGTVALRLDFAELGPNGLSPGATIPASEVAVLTGAMARGQSFGIIFDDPAWNLPVFAAIPLIGAPSAIAEWQADCLPEADVTVPPAAVPVPGADATPLTDPVRFALSDAVAGRDRRGVDLAQTLLAPEIAQATAGSGRGPEVLGDLVAFQDGRYLLIAQLCDPTFFGITGCETHVFTSPRPDAPLTRSMAGLIGGGPYWIDLRLGVAGWPDILVQPRTGGGTFARLRWQGAGYDLWLN